LNISLLGNPVKLVDSVRRGLADLLMDSTGTLTQRVPQPSVIAVAILAGSRSAYLHFSAGVFGLIATVKQQTAGIPGI